MSLSSGGAAGNVRGAVQELFSIYLGTSKGKGEVHSREKQVSKVQRRVANGWMQPPKDEQFTLDFLQLQSQFQDLEQLRFAAETVLATLIVQCSDHALQVDFLLFAMQALARLGMLRWDSFVSLLLRTVASAENGGLQPGYLQAPNSVAGLQSPPGGPLHMMLMGSSANPASPSPPNLVASPAQPTVDPNQTFFQSTVGATTSPVSKSLPTTKAICWLRPVVCKILFVALDSELKPVTCFEILAHIVQWINFWDTKSPTGVDGQGSNNSESTSWLHSCVEIVWTLIGEHKCRVPFYAVLHDRTQLRLDKWPDDETLFSLILEVHRRRDNIVLHVLMLDHHLHCPTFSTLRMTALTYPGSLGEPLHGEDVANAVPRGSLDWERSLRCLRHALRYNPSSDWWKKVLVVAARYRQQPQIQTATPRQALVSVTQPALEFSADMTCEAVIDRIMELMQPLNTGSGSPNVSISETGRWQEWLIFSDLFYFFMRSGYIDFLDFIDKLAARFARGEQPVIRSNHVTWLLAQVFRLETVTTTLSTDARKHETAQKILSFHMAERPIDQATNLPPQNMLLDFVGSSQILRLWSLNRQMIEHLTGNRLPEHILKGKQIDEWWKQVMKGERILDYSNLEDKSMGMVWVLSHTVSQPICEAIMTWMNSKGVTEIMVPGQPGDRMAVFQEIRPLPVLLLSGLSLHLCFRLINQIEEIIFAGQVVPSIGMVETYVRLLLVAPQTLFRSHVNGMMQRYQQGLSKSGVSLLLLELLNYRLFSLYRYHGKVKQLIFDIAKILITVKVKRGEHRLFRLAENLGINLILSLREVMLVKKELKGATTEFTETLNRVMVINLAFTMKTRGIAEMEHMLVLQPALEQILASSHHTWSDKTMRHFPPSLREALAGRPDKRAQIILSWQQAEATVMHHCRQLLSPTVDPSYVLTYINHSFPQHRQYLCAGAWMLMEGHPESINTGNLGRALKELSPDEVTTNIYMLVDVLLHNIHLQLQHGHQLHDLLLRASAGLAILMWTQELLPFDITLLALIDRDDDTHALRLVVGLLLDRPEFLQRVQHHCSPRGQQDHWSNPGPFQRSEPQQALGQHLAGKDRFPIFFDEMYLRALPIIPLIIYRLIENDATETAERVLASYSSLLFYHPAQFTFVRDTLAYFYGSLPSKLIVRLLSSLDLTKIPFSEAFLQHIGSLNSGSSLLQDYYTNLLLGLVNKVIPPVGHRSKLSCDGLPAILRAASTRTQGAMSPTASNTAEYQKAFYHHQDPGTYSQLVLETAVVELLSLPPPPNQVVAMLVNVAVRIPSPPQHLPVHGHHGGQATAGGHSQNVASGTPRSPLSPNAASESLNSAGSVPSGTGSQIVLLATAPLVIQACGLLLAQLPTAFHGAFYSETARIIKDCWWLTDQTRGPRELETVFSHALWDPSWAAQDETSTVVGNTVALLHAFASNLPFDWLEGMHAVITLQRPISSVTHLRLAFRIMGPILPRLVISRPLFAKTLALLFTIMADVFGRNAPQTAPCEPSEILDLVDFLHHAVILETHGSGSSGGKPRPETLLLCSKAVERLRPELQLVFKHLNTDPNSSIYAATHPKLIQRPGTSMLGVM